MSWPFATPFGVAACGLVVTAVIGSTIHATSAIYGVVDGILASAVSLASLKGLSSLLVAAHPSPRTGVLITVLVAVVKLPMLLLGTWIAVRLPSPGLFCFLASVGLVYSAFVWGVTRDATSG